MTSPSPPVLPGLEHVQLLGSGGFADVHLYRQELPRMLVAVKVLRASTGEDQRRQLVDEANTMAELAEHPYIVTIFRAGTTDDGRPYLVMAYHPQPSLSARARANPLSVAEALRTGIHLSSAVETAHRAGVLHRDIKPANVLTTSYGTPSLADFGIAGRADTVHDDDEIGVSVAWAPPEVLRGHSNGSVVADVYSLTATIWYLLTGRTPFEQPGGDNSERALLLRTTHDPVPRTGRPDVPESLERLLEQGLAKDPAHRPQSALALARDLQRVEQELRLPRTEVVVLDREDDDQRTVTGTATTVRSALPEISSTPQEPAATGGSTAVGPRSPRWLLALLAGIAVALLVGIGVWGTLLLNRGNGSTSGEQTAGKQTASEQTSGLDPCVVGSWRNTEHSETLGGVGTLTSLDRDLEITQDGRLTITYDQTKAGGTDYVFDGTVEYQVRTHEGTMSFDLVRNDLTLTPPNPALQPGTGDVSYTCTDDTFVESAPGFRSAYVRRS